MKGPGRNRANGGDSGEEQKVERKKLTIKRGLRVSNDNVNTWDTKMTEPVKQTRSAFSSQLTHTNTTGNDTDDKMAGEMDGGKSLEIARSKSGGIQSSSREGEGLLQEE